MRVVILGCGRVGARVARALDGEHQVTVIDWNPAAFSRLPATFGGDTVVGNGIDADCLHSAGADWADIFLALTDADNRNLMAAQVAEYLGAKRVIGRVYDAERSQIFTDIGVSTFSPTILGAERMFHMVLGDEEG